MSENQNPEPAKLEKTENGSGGNQGLDGTAEPREASGSPDKNGNNGAPAAPTDPTGVNPPADPPPGATATKATESRQQDHKEQEETEGGGKNSKESGDREVTKSSEFFKRRRSDQSGPTFTKAANYSGTDDQSKLIAAEVVDRDLRTVVLVTRMGGQSTGTSLASALANGENVWQENDQSGSEHLAHMTFGSLLREIDQTLGKSAGEARAIIVPAKYSDLPAASAIRAVLESSESKDVASFESNLRVRNVYLIVVLDLGTSGRTWSVVRSTHFAYVRPWTKQWLHRFAQAAGFNHRPLRPLANELAGVGTWNGPGDDVRECQLYVKLQGLRGEAYRGDQAGAEDAIRDAIAAAQADMDALGEQSRARLEKLFRVSQAEWQARIKQVMVIVAGFAGPMSSTTFLSLCRFLVRDEEALIDSLPPILHQQFARTEFGEYRCGLHQVIDEVADDLLNDLGLASRDSFEVALGDEWPPTIDVPREIAAHYKMAMNRTIEAIGKWGLLANSDEALRTAAARLLGAVWKHCQDGISTQAIADALPLHDRFDHGEEDFIELAQRLHPTTNVASLLDLRRLKTFLEEADDHDHEHKSARIMVDLMKKYVELQDPDADLAHIEKTALNVLRRRTALAIVRVIEEVVRAAGLHEHEGHSNRLALFRCYEPRVDEPRDVIGIYAVALSISNILQPDVIAQRAMEILEEKPIARSGLVVELIFWQQESIFFSAESRLALENWYEAFPLPKQDGDAFSTRETVAAFLWQLLVQAECMAVNSKTEKEIVSPVSSYLMDLQRPQLPVTGEDADEQWRPGSAAHGIIDWFLLASPKRRLAAQQAIHDWVTVDDPLPSTYYHVGKQLKITLQDAADPLSIGGTEDLRAFVSQHIEQVRWEVLERMARTAKVHLPTPRSEATPKVVERILDATLGKHRHDSRWLKLYGYSRPATLLSWRFGAFGDRTLQRDTSEYERVIGLLELVAESLDEDSGREIVDGLRALGEAMGRIVNLAKRRKKTVVETIEIRKRSVDQMANCLESKVRRRQLVPVE